METAEIKREILAGGKIRLSGEGCSFTYERARPGMLLVTIQGHDRGQFGTSTLDEILNAIQKEGPIELFVDARNAVGISVSVSDSWTRFFTLNKDKLKRVHVLVASEYIQLTVAIAQHLSGTGDLIKIHSKEENFTSALNGARDHRSS
jgi:hypothetical protein